ncbi:MAG: FGGY family carbohydrate kinase [Saprospiraceae bacterium]|nr:FGGY family carbohydrate kinase [Saprospiraceae bacterium]
MYLLGYDIGSSSIKAALVRIADHATVGRAQHPNLEMEILAPQPDWAEQHPETWWENLCKVTQQLLADTEVPPYDIQAIGIAYQMHGLVLVDKDQKVLRPSIIWCDSRAVKIGNQAFTSIGEEKCLSHLLNSPGNFTASKLKWVKDNEPKVYEQIDKIMLPGDYIAMKLTGEVVTTASGLSEGIFWDFQENKVSDAVMNYFGFSDDLIPNIVQTFSVQGKVTDFAAEATGLRAGIPVTYRAGDQPNNALSLNVFNPGELAATGGTSGVVYGIVDKPAYDPQSRVNGFAHVNHSIEAPRIGILLCINGTGIQYSWIKQHVAQDGLSYNDLEQLASKIPVGSDGLQIIPFGNGAERMLNNRNLGASIHHLHFNRHTRAHLYRAALEGIAFSFVYGIQILKEMGLEVKHLKVGNDNLFQSAIFSNTITTLTDSPIEVIETTGAIGAAKAAGVGIGEYNSPAEAIGQGNVVRTYKPLDAKEAYAKAYQSWESDLHQLIH